MSYIAVDLDALSAIPLVGTASGLGADRVLYGLVKLWEWCWRREDDLVTDVHLLGFFGSAEHSISQALEAFGFVAPEDGKYRVRGADRYLRVRRAQREAGRRTAERRSAQKTSSTSAPPAAPAATPPAALLEVESSPTASSDQRTASSESTTEAKKPLSTSSTGAPPALALAPEEAPSAQEPAAPRPPSATLVVFEAWKTTMGHPKAKLDAKRERAIKARLQDGYTVDDLKLAISGCAATPHNMGKNDRGERFDDIELICRSSSQVDRFMANAKTRPKLKVDQCPNDISPEARDFFTKYAGCQIDFETELPITDPEGNPLPYPGAPFELARKASAS